jgi:hypothetical protein
MNIQTFASTPSSRQGRQAAPCIPFEVMMEIIQDPSFDLIENIFIFAGWSPLLLLHHTRDRLYHLCLLLAGLPPAPELRLPSAPQSINAPSSS